MKTCLQCGWVDAVRKVKTDCSSLKLGLTAAAARLRTDLDLCLAGALLFLLPAFTPGVTPSLRTSKAASFNGVNLFGGAFCFADKVGVFSAVVDAGDDRGVADRDRPDGPARGGASGTAPEGETNLST